MNELFKRLIPISVIIIISLLFSELSILADSLRGGTLADLNPEWSPDGSRIAFISNRNGNHDIYVMNADGSNQINITSDPLDETSPAWSPDGERIAYLYSDYQDGSVRLMRPDGSDKKNLTPVYRTWHTRFSWSPDSSAITYSSPDNQIQEGRRDREIFLLDIYTSNQIKLTSNYDTDLHPSFSPDGSKISYLSGTPWNKMNLWLMNVDGTGLKELAKNVSSAIPPVWWPDSSKIMFQGQSDFAERASIFIVDIDGNKQVTLSDDSSSSYHPSLSPDSSKVAFVSYRDGNREILVTDVDNKNTIRLTFNDYHDDYPVWSPDGGKILFRNERQILGRRVHSINVIDINSREIIALTDWYGGHLCRS